MRFKRTLKDSVEEMSSKYVDVIKMSPSWVPKALAIDEMSDRVRLCRQVLVVKKVVNRKNCQNRRHTLKIIAPVSNNVIETINTEILGQR